MDIHFKNSRMRKTCADYKELRIKYGDPQAKQIVARINELQAAESLHDILCLPQARLHKLGGNLKDCFAVDIKHPYRLILVPLDGEITNMKSIKSVEIREIEDYH